MLVGARGDLRRMRHRHHLHLAGEPRQPRADRVGHSAADAGVDFVEHQRGRRAAIGQHHLERQQEPRQLAAGGDLHQRSRLGAGIGLHPEFDAVEALRPRRLRIGLDLRHELGAFELQRRQFGVDRLVEFFGRLCRARRKVLSQPRCSAASASAAAALQLLQLIGAGVDQRHVGGIFRGQCRQPIDRRRIFARRGAQREQPLLDAFQFGGIEIRRDQRRVQMLVGLLQRVDRGIDRLHRGLDQRRRICRRGAPAGAPPPKAPEPANDCR